MLDVWTVEHAERDIHEPICWHWEKQLSELLLEEVQHQRVVEPRRQILLRELQYEAGSYKTDDDKKQAKDPADTLEAI